METILARFGSEYEIVLQIRFSLIVSLPWPGFLKGTRDVNSDKAESPNGDLF